MKLLPIAAALLSLVVIALSLARAWRLLQQENSRRLDSSEDEELLRLTELAERRALLLQQMRNIRFDAEMGKMSERDRDAVLRRLERLTLAVSRDLDALRGSDADEALARDAVAAVTAPILADADSEGWSAVARLRRKKLAGEG